MKLYVVATPIGNLKDISARALETFRSVDAIISEDTRVTLKLLNAYEIKKTLISYHEHSTETQLQNIINTLKQGKNFALVTDAGTPAISDPGSYLISRALEALGNELQVIPIPGPSALITALSISGFPADRFVFLGFPPHKKGREKFFSKIVDIEDTCVLYESTHRILKTMEALCKITGERKIVVCRELSKIHETIYRGCATDVLKTLKSDNIKGEFVIVIGPI